MTDGVTVALPRCEPACPTLDEWPTTNLIQGRCPRCSAPPEQGDWKVVRMLRARRLIEGLMAR